MSKKSRLTYKELLTAHKEASLDLEESKPYNRKQNIEALEEIQKCICLALLKDNEKMIELIGDQEVPEISEKIFIN
jgi:hypothetical protein